MHVLIASHPNEQSAAVLLYGLEFAKRVGARCTILHVIAAPADRVRGRDVLQARAAQATQIGVHAQTELRLGQPAEQIVHLAYEADVNVVILGEGKADAFFGQLLTPPSERVLANAPCPVLLLRGAALQPQRILVLHGGSEAVHTLPSFLKQAGSILVPGCEVTLLHVMSQMGVSHQVSGWELTASAQELISKRTEQGIWLEEAMTLFAPYEGVVVQPKVRHGLVLEEIVAEAREGDYDLIVLGRHASRGWQTFLVDNIAKEVIQQVKRPILIFGKH